jgi:hypothetical protein
VIADRNPNAFILLSRGSASCRTGAASSKLSARTAPDCDMMAI